MSNRPYKNIKRFVDNLSADIAIKMGDTPLIEVEQPDDSIDLAGKTASELVSEFEIQDNVITATLPYVEGYTGYSEEVSEQEGNYLPLMITSQLEDAAISVKVGKNTYNVEESGALVLRVEKSSIKIVITAKTETETVIETILANLELGKKEEE